MRKTKHKDNNFYIVKRMRLLEHLINNGFEVIKSIPDPTNPKFNWWLFNNSAELKEAVEQYYNAG